MLKRIVAIILCLMLLCAEAVWAAPKQDAKKPAYTKADISLLAKVVQLEAGNTSERAQLAVGTVVLNRVKNKQFPNSLSKVIYQKGQFSVVHLKKWKTLKPSKLSLSSAKKVLEGKRILDEDVLYFKWKGLSRRWGKRVYVTTIGGNMFYK